MKFKVIFIKKGEKYLKPLKLSDISSELNVHESTVSRITSNKYILCERGIINLKEFFSNKLTQIVIHHLFQLDL